MNGADLLAFAVGFLLGWFVFAPRKDEQVLTVRVQRDRIVESDVYRGTMHRNLDLEVEVVEAIKKRNITKDDDTNRESPITLTKDA